MESNLFGVIEGTNSQGRAMSVTSLCRRNRFGGNTVQSATLGQAAATRPRERHWNKSHIAAVTH